MIPLIMNPRVIQDYGIKDQGSSYDQERICGVECLLLLDLDKGHLSCSPCDLGMFLYEFFMIIMFFKSHRYNLIG